MILGRGDFLLVGGTLECVGDHCSDGGNYEACQTITSTRSTTQTTTSFVDLWLAHHHHHRQFQCPILPSSCPPTDTH